MQTIGLVGGMSWESTAVYYRDLNVGVQERLGGLSSPKLVLSAVDFAELTAVEDAVGIPLLHLGDVVADEVRSQGVDRVGFIGTTVAMSDGFFADRLARHGLEVVMPDPRHHELLNSAIYDELVHGRVVDATRRRVLGVLDELWDSHVGGVLLGCTELELLIHQADADLPVYPCTTLHVNAALDRALAD